MQPLTIVSQTLLTSVTTFLSDKLSKKAEGQAAGAKAWMVKPFKPDQMLMAVSKLCLP